MFECLKPYTPWPAWNYAPENAIRTLVFHPKISNFPIEYLARFIVHRSVLEELDAEHSKARTLQRTDMIKEELMINTWHPQRHIAWCLGEQDFCLGGEQDFCLGGEQS